MSLRETDWTDGPVRLMHGDVRERLADLEPESVQCVVTSPPYWGLRDYGATGQLGLEATPDAYVTAMADVFRAVWRVLRRDGTLWLNLGDSYNAYNGNAGPGSKLSQTQSAVRPHLASGHGLRTPGLKPKDLVGIPWRVAFALQAAGWYLRSDIIWSKPNPMPESVTDRPTKAHEYLFLLSRSERYFYDAGAIKEVGTNEAGGPSRSRLEKHREGDERFRYFSGLVGGIAYSTRNKRSVWEIATQPYPDAHFATFPEALVEPCILAGSREGDVVLDPFAGSGTTLAVARRLGREAIGIELQPDYLPLIQRRVMASAMPLTEAIRHIDEATA